MAFVASVATAIASGLQTNAEHHSKCICRNAFDADLILPADVSHVATDGDALVVRTNGNEETPNGNDAMADCVPCKLRGNQLHQTRRAFQLGLMVD